MTRDFKPNEVEELTYETESKALFHFRRDVLMKHAWDYRKGATHRTFFVGQRLGRISEIYRRWLGSEARNNHLLADHEDLVGWVLVAMGVDQRAVDGILADGLLAGMKDPRVRAAMRLTAAARSQAEIGRRNTAFWHKDKIAALKDAMCVTWSVCGVQKAAQAG